MLLQKQHKMTSKEYLILERKSEYKNEYFNGEIFAMAGATREHNQISSNIIRVLGNYLIDSECSVFSSDMRIKIEAIEKYTYPDVVVMCSNSQFEEQDTLINPIVIMEILSTSTEGYDRGDKFSHYQFIESFMEYILISQYVYRVEKFLRQKDGTWIYSKYHNPKDVIKIESINFELPVSEIYRKVNIKPFLLG
ncbi:MAG: Uma2 family endonuclease [Desulfamplus sp.]|nr:Uma2 family endonuclease [Desulfamplus sp.]